MVQGLKVDLGGPFPWASARDFHIPCVSFSELELVFGLSSLRVVNLDGTRSSFPRFQAAIPDFLYKNRRRAVAS